MKKRYLLYILPVILIIIMIVTGYRDSVKTNLSGTFAPISFEHYFGTDHLGRDIFSLIVDGAVRTLATVVIASLISVSFGLILGMLGGYFGKSLEIVIVFFTDMLMIVPSFIMALIISAIFGLNPVTAGITLGITGIGTYTNQTMILTRQIKNRGFILSEKALGNDKAYTSQYYNAYTCGTWQYGKLHSLAICFAFFYRFGCRYYKAGLGGTSLSI